MNVLFISNNNWPDYMSDMVLHGGKTLFGNDFEELNKNPFIYSDFLDLKNIYGKGFTIYGKLPIEMKDTSANHNILNKIQNKFYDKIIYGSCRRNLSHFDLITKIYSFNQIIFIDGEDDNEVNFDLTNYGIYFKRELVKDFKNVLPINFAIPENLILSFVPNKTKQTASIIPGDTNTYIFDNEIDYYQDYQISWHAHTKKKAGWDCLRHYEILMNGCIPVFENLQSCPHLTLTKFPKEILLRKNIVYNNDLILELLNYTREHLSTKKLIEYVLN